MAERLVRGRRLKSPNLVGNNKNYWEPCIEEGQGGMKILVAKDRPSESP